MARIESITATEVLDSRGVPTIRAKVFVSGGFSGVATVPSGASTGKHEAWELRDEDSHRYEGKGVLGAVEKIRTSIHAALLGKDTANQIKIDTTLIELDGTKNKSNLGANSMLAVSLACARAEAVSQGLPLYLYLQQLIPKTEMRMPIPQMNLLNGGRHASNKMSIQEFHVVPAGATSFAEALRMGTEIGYKLKALLQADGFQTEVGDEGGFAPMLDDSETVFAYLVRAIEEAGYIPGSDAWLGIDAAASEFFDADQNIYILDGAGLTVPDIAERYRSWQERYPLISIEDPFDQDDWVAWSDFTKAYDTKLQIVGDDLFVTNKDRIQEGIMTESANSVLIKPNQVGTLSETIEAILMAQKANMNVIVSHRSGETEDTFIADLAVATSAGQIKTGAAARSERVAKYNRLLEIEQALEKAPMSHDLQRFFEGRPKAAQSAGGVHFNRHV